MPRVALPLVALILSLGFASAGEPLVTVLDNGLTVITQEFHYAPVVASVLTYGVGSRNESGDILGMSHFCEHLMFKGTPDMPKSRFWQIVQRDGGWANAFTSNDVTCYFLFLPSARIQDALDIESDRMINCLLDSAEVISEANVVHEERRSAVTDSPTGALWEAMGQTAFTVHPYANPVIGYDENILAFDHNKAREYYSTYYSPSNAVLSVVGDFDTQQLLMDIETAFGDIPRGETPPSMEIFEPEQTEPRFVSIEHGSNLPRFIIGFHTPDGLDPSTPALDLIGAYLSGGRSSRFEQTLVEPGMVMGAGAWNDGGIDPGLFNISVTMYPPSEDGHGIDEVMEMIWDELEIISSEGIPEDDLADLRNRYLASEILSDASPIGLAMDYSISSIMFGDHLHSSRQMEMIEQVTSDDIREAATEFFTRDAVTIAVLEPSGGMGGGPGSEGAELPTDVMEPSSIDYDGLEIPDGFLVPPDNSISEGVETHEFPNGLTLLIREDHTFPIAAVCLVVPMGSLRHGPETSGLCGVTVETMMKGTEELGSIEFHRRLESEGSSLRFGSGREFSTASVTLLSEDLELALETVSDLLIRPALREEDYLHVMEESYSSLEMRAERAFSVAMDSLTVMTANSRDSARLTTSETLDGITLEMVHDFHELCCRPEGSVLAVVGDVDPEHVLALTENWFGNWDNPEIPLPVVEVPGFSEAPGDTVITPMPGKVQAAVMIGRNAPGRDMPDFAAFSVMNTILGRGIGSRLGHSVRDEQGLAYSVGSWSAAMDSTGVFTAYLSTLGAYVPQATSSVIAEMERIASENVGEMELRLAKANAVGTQAMSGAGYSDQASTLARLQAEGRPLDWHDSYLVDVLELTADDIREAAALYLVPGEWFVSIAGGVEE